MNGPPPSVIDVLGGYDRLVEVGIGSRTDVAAALADRGVSVLATDVVERSVPENVSFARDDVTDPTLSHYADAEAIYALRLPPDLQPAVATVAARVDIPLYFTTLGGDPPVIETSLQAVRSGTLYEHRPNRGPRARDGDPHV